ncbi:MAG: type IV pilus modification protein PilV [Geoalkalibacter sp.]|jgi:type IV pilus assembly protein PilV|uniref:type IV pilus modification protein PilV n=1 Tax=Geoalkalibacter sp. TaxID=3041440 RepID=UPI002A9D7A23|nr:type IV pilus modification protein PilV [Thermodesulfobacteriota bacterium]
MRFRSNNLLPASNSRGFTLVEVLAALVIISVGLLGLAALQGQSLRGNHSAAMRTQAVNQVENIVDRMRANRAEALDGAYAIGMGVAPAAPAYSGLVLVDLQEWRELLSQSLSLGDGSVAMDGDVCTVVVQWTEPAGTKDLTVVTRL